MSCMFSCFFPTSVVFIDDSGTFLNELCNTLHLSNLFPIKITNSQKALQMINDSCNNNCLDSSLIISYGEDNFSDKQSVLLNINKIHEQIYNQERFNTISTIVVDYEMHGINGVDLCSKIKNTHIQRILLTGVADENIAIEAFNQGYINKYIKKTNNFEQDLENAIDRSINKYFTLYTDEIYKYIEGCGGSHLKDPIFSNLFTKICETKNYLEYYLLDNFGSYLFLDKTGNTHFLSVITENEIDSLLNLAKESCEGSQGLIDALSSREWMLSFHNRYGQLPPVDQWEQYLYPATKLNGYQTYYFCIREHKNLDIDFKKIKSFEFFLKNNNN